MLTRAFTLTTNYKKPPVSYYNSGSLRARRNQTHFDHRVCTVCTRGTWLRGIDSGMRILYQDAESEAEAVLLLRLRFTPATFPARSK
eukprot:2289339-Rhodomonas_salina.2